jgi:DNA-binding PadR family transcriptional regulator
MTATVTTTGYAILGHLAMRPWTMYELAAQMRRNVHYFYPRAESQIYAEPKRLVAMGLAESEVMLVGRRQRTTYSITAKGRRALSDWLAAPVSSGPLLEFEGLLRIFLAPFGTRSDMQSTLALVREQIQGLLDLSRGIREEYLNDRAPFQHYAPTRAMIHDFLTSFGLLVAGWAERSLREVERWETMPEQRQMAAAIDTFRRNAIEGNKETSGAASASVATVRTKRTRQAKRQTVGAGRKR